MMLLTSLLSLGTITWLAYQAGKQALTEAATNQLTSVRAAKKQQVEYYFKSMRDTFRAIADAPVVATAIQDLAAGYDQLGRERLSPQREAALELFYTKEFLPRLGRNVDTVPRLDQVWPGSAAMRELQALFISENPGPVGGKAVLAHHAIDNAYTRAHSQHHRWFEALARRLKFYDVMLVDAETANIVYSVSKETDLGQNLNNGPVAGTHLAELVRSVLRTRQPWDVRLSDFDFYTPSYNAPSAFIAAPVLRGQKLIGVIAAQISTEALAAFMHDGKQWRQQGLGETGAVYLIGSDSLMRSDTREIIERPEAYAEQIAKAGTVPPAVAQRILQQKTTILHYPIRNAAVSSALQGRSGTELLINRRGFGAYLSYAPLDIPDLRWVIVARMDENEVLASQIRFNRNVLVAACILALLATLAALWLARHFLRPMATLLGGIERLHRGERGVIVESRSRDEFNDLVSAFNAMSTTIKQRDEVIEAKSLAHERLLKRIFPEAVADRMKLGEASVVESLQQVTVVYAIIDGFASVAEARSGEQAIKLLNEIVDRFDTVAEQHGVEKVKTIGDHYLAVAGLSVARLDHARRALEVVQGMWRELSHVNQAYGLSLGLRAGIATGTGQAGLVGSRRFVYDIWGGATSTARRIVYDADINSVRLNADACAQITDRDGIGDELAIKTRTLGTVKTFQLRLAGQPVAKAAE